LLRSRNTLHRSVVNNHVVGLQCGVFLGNGIEGVSEKAIGQLHDVGLVDAGDLLAVVCESEAEGELGDTLRLCAGDDFERLDDTWDRLVLQARVFSLGVLTDDAEVDILVAGLVTWDVLDEDNGRIDIEFLSHGNVERLVAGSLDGCV